MARLMLLSVMNFAAVIVAHLAFRAWQQQAAPRDYLALMSWLGFLFIPLRRLFEQPLTTQIVLLTTGSILGALIIEGILRRFVDRPKDTDAK